MQASLRWPLRLLATAGVAVAVLAVLAPTATQALPDCGYVVTYYSDPGKTSPVGWRYVEPWQCGCDTVWVGEPGRYTSVALFGDCLP